VIGTHGASRWGRLFGNVPEKVLRFARVPVLVVR
jgi:nucleotide-binding universal stress UspA family protein